MMRLFRKLIAPLALATLALPAVSADVTYR